jgi:uncharacterized membrane protein YgaE (UPF0421/DUF939 family)
MDFSWGLVLAVALGVVIGELVIMLIRMVR